MLLFSHDLRTPLTILKGHTTMLLSFIPKGLVSQQGGTRRIINSTQQCGTA